MLKHLVTISLSVLSVGLAVTLFVGRFIAPVNNVAEYISIGCNDTITQKLIIDQVIERRTTLPLDTCTNEQMEFIVTDAVMPIVALIIILGVIRLGMMFAPANSMKAAAAEA